MHSVAKICSDLSLFEQIFLVISKFLQILVLYKSFPLSLEQFFLAVGRKDFGNKIPDILLFHSHSVTQTLYNVMKRGLWTNDYYSDTLQP